MLPFFLKFHRAEFFDLAKLLLKVHFFKNPHKEHELNKSFSVNLEQQILHGQNQRQGPFFLNILQYSTRIPSVHIVCTVAHRICFVSQRYIDETPAGFSEESSIRLSLLFFPGMCVTNGPVASYSFSECTFSH